MSERDETFTIGEMREAYNRSVRGLPLTEKQKSLVEARRAAVRATSRYDWTQTELSL